MDDSTYEYFKGKADADERPISVYVRRILRQWVLDQGKAVRLPNGQFAPKE